MSLNIPIEAVPNQSFFVLLDDVRYEIRLRNIGDTMCVDVFIDDETVVEGHRVVGGFPLIPYKHLEKNGGNFIFITDCGDLVYWEKFGITQFLLYFTASELEDLRGN